MLKIFRNQKGFTLIELMVVVAILAILAIIAMPRIIMTLENSRRSEAVATATTIVNGIIRYSIEHKVYPSGADDSPQDILDWTHSEVDATLSDYIDLRNPESIASITYGYGPLDSGDTNIESPLPVIDDGDRWLVIVFENARNMDGDPAECLLTAEAIRWRGEMR